MKILIKKTEDSKPQEINAHMILLKHGIFSCVNNEIKCETYTIKDLNEIWIKE